jgi:hypothetical protein
MKETIGGLSGALSDKRKTRGRQKAGQAAKRYGYGHRFNSVRVTFKNSYGRPDLGQVGPITNSTPVYNSGRNEPRVLAV